MVVWKTGLALGLTGTSALATPQETLADLDVLNADPPHAFWFFNLTDDIVSNCSSITAELSYFDGGMLVGSPYKTTTTVRDELSMMGPEELALRFLPGNARNGATPDGVTDVWRTEQLFFPGHWAYTIGGTLDVAIDDTVVCLDVSVPSGVLSNHFMLHDPGNGQLVGDDIVIVETDPSGAPDWSTAEMVRLVAIGGPGCSSVEVERGRFGTAARSFPAGARVAAVATPGASPSGSIRREFNWSTLCPKDTHQLRAADVYWREIMLLFAPPALTPIPIPPNSLGVIAAVGATRGSNEFMHGVQFDVLPTEKTVTKNNRLYDFNNDGVADQGYFVLPGETSETNTILAGVNEFLNNLRGSFPFKSAKRLITADGQTETGNRPNGALNGVELEGFPYGWNRAAFSDWSTGLNQLELWRNFGETPRFSFVNMRFHDPDEDCADGSSPAQCNDVIEVPLARRRAIMALTTIYDWAVAIQDMELPEPSDCVGKYDELTRGTADLVHWLGAPAGPTRDLIDNPADDRFDPSMAAFSVTNGFRAWSAATNQLDVLPGPGPWTQGDTLTIDLDLTALAPLDASIEGVVLLFDVKLGVPDSFAHRLTAQLTGYQNDKTVNNIVFYAHDDWVRVQCYWKEHDPLDGNLEFEFEFDLTEGTQPILFRDFRLYQGEPYLGREFQEGVVLVNPSLADWVVDPYALFPQPGSVQLWRLDGHPAQADSPPTGFEDYVLPVYNTAGQLLPGQTIAVGQRDAIFLRKRSAIPHNGNL